MKLNGNLVERLSREQLFQPKLESNDSKNIKDLINNNSGLKSFGWIGNDSEEKLAQVESFACDCPECCGNVSPDLDFSNTANGRLLENTDASLFAAAKGDVTKINYSGKNYIDSLIYPAKWTSKTITYSFFDGGKYYGSEGNVKPITEKMKGYLRDILKSFEQYIDLKFVEVSDKGDNYGQIRYMFSDGPSTAYAKVPYKYQTSPKAGDVHFSPNSRSKFDAGPGAYRYETLIHETLHALDLKHPGNYNGSSTGGQSGEFLPNGDDNSNNSILSYNRFSGASDYAGTITPMSYDIRALHYMYGAAENNNGDTIYKFDKIDEYYVGNKFYGNKSSNSKQTMWDSGGEDTFDLSGLGSNNSGYRVDLRGGGIVTEKNLYNTTSYKARGDGKRYNATSRGTFLAYDSLPNDAYDMTIENVISSGSDDDIFANEEANTFSGYTTGRIFGDDKIFNSNGLDKIDLSSFKVSDFTTRTSGDDYILDFGQSGSIKIKDYYKAAEGDRIKIITSDSNPTPEPTPVNGALVWENLYLPEDDEKAVASGSQFNLGNGVTATVNWNIITDGGSFESNAGEDYVSFESGKTGNHTGYLSLGFNNSNDDPDDLIKLSLDFNQAVTGLNFKLLDVDEGAGKKFDDGVEIYADGVNVKSLSDVDIVTGDNVFADNEPYMDGFEGRGGVGANDSSEEGNISLNFGTTEVKILEIKYFSTDDAISDPGGQKIGISDLAFQTT